MTDPSSQEARLERLVELLDKEFPLASSKRFRFHTAGTIVRYALTPHSLLPLAELKLSVDEAMEGKEWHDTTEYDRR